MDAPADNEDPESLHPALSRFLGAHPGGERLLIVRAPLATGARWFAEGWVGQDADRRVLVSPHTCRDAEALLETVRSLLDEDDDGRVAVVGGLDMPLRRLAGAFPALLAGPADVMLTVDEIRQAEERRSRAVRGSTPARDLESARAAAHSGAHGPADGPAGQYLHPPDGPKGAAPLPGVPPLTPERIHEKTGGWLQAVEMLLQDPLGAWAAKQAIVTPLLRWLTPRDPDGAIAETAFLPSFSREILEDFFPDRVPAGPTLRTLQELGLVVRSSDGHWFMPVLIREVLKESVIEADPQRAREVSDAAINATVAYGGVQLALETALRDRAWKRMAELILDHWVDLYIQDAPVLTRLVGRLPRFAFAGLDVLGLVSRLTWAADGTPMDIQQPAVDRGYAHDEFAQRLHAQTERFYRNPDQRALTLGIAETGHLRQSGYFEAAVQAADRLREAVVTVQRDRGARPVILAFAELQAGISLHRADRLTDARSAYESAYHKARTARSDFLLADVTGKLALVNAQQGRIDRARYWLERVDRPLAQVRWGRQMVQRAAILARLHVALAELDLEAVRELLAELPAEPDGDEFAAVHAYIVALARNYQGTGAVAVELVMRWQQHASYASRSPLADRLIIEAFQMCRLSSGHMGVVPGWERSEMLANLEAVRCLAAQDADGALRALRVPERINPRNRYVAAIVGVIARAKATPDDPSKEVLRQLTAVLPQEGELADLVYFHPLGWTPVFRRIGMVDDSGVARLDALAPFRLTPERVPVLTPREHEVLRMLREGLTRKQMAISTFRSENTIKGQMRSLYAKLGASSAQEALEAARHYGL